MMPSYVQIKPGRKLTKKELNLINSHRQKEFGQVALIEPSPTNEDWDKKYFLVKNLRGQLLAFGRFHDVEVVFMDQTYQVLGLASVVSLVRKKGFGKKLVKKMYQWARKNKKTVIGFCDPRVAGFYHKCGLETELRGSNRLLRGIGIYKMTSYRPDNDLIYTIGPDGFDKKIQASPKEIIFALKESW